MFLLFIIIIYLFIFIVYYFNYNIVELLLILDLLCLLHNILDKFNSLHVMIGSCFSHRIRVEFFCRETFLKKKNPGHIEDYGSFM